MVESKINICGVFSGLWPFDLRLPHPPATGAIDKKSLTEGGIVRAGVLIALLASGDVGAAFDVCEMLVLIDVAISLSLSAPFTVCVCVCVCLPTSWC